jgi:hypothetical protein
MNSIRKSNALKLLKKHCNGVIKEFANKLDKNERQCSNFLREKNPHSIGNMIARQIESAFGYPVGWLDIEEELEQLKVESVGVEYASIMEQLESALSKINQIIFDAPPLKESLWLNEHMLHTKAKGEVILRECNTNLVNSMANSFTKFMRSEHGVILHKTSLSRFLASSKFIFRLLPYSINSEREQNLLPDELLDINKYALFKKEVLLFDVRPFVFNGDLKYAFIEQDVFIAENEYISIDGDVQKFTLPLISDEADNTKALSTLIDKNSAFIYSDSAASGLGQYINTHPKLVR